MCSVRYHNKLNAKHAANEECGTQPLHSASRTPDRSRACNNLIRWLCPPLWASPHCEIWEAMLMHPTQENNIQCEQARWQCKLCGPRATLRVAFTVHGQLCLGPMAYPILLCLGPHAAAKVNAKAKANANAEVNVNATCHCNCQCRCQGHGQGQ
jgi:hypothetical protein